LVGAIPEPYLPFHRLGVVRYALRDCARALVAFERSAEQGVAAALPEAQAEAAPRRRDCGDLRDADVALVAARAAAARTPASSATAAAALLEEAARDLATARSSWDFDAARRALATAAAARRLSEESADAPAPAAAPVPEPPAPGSGVPSQPPSAPDEPTTTWETPAEPPATAPSAAPGAPSPPTSVRAAVEAYFAGSYGAAVELLDVQLGRRSLDEPARFLAYFIRGASRYALYLLGGEDETSLSDGAAEDLRAAHAVRPAFRPSVRDFSPRLVEYYEGLVADSR
jgi:hypothetical protein